MFHSTHLHIFIKFTTRWRIKYNRAEGGREEGGVGARGKGGGGGERGRGLFKGGVFLIDLPFIHIHSPLCVLFISMEVGAGIRCDCTTLRGETLLLVSLLN